MFTTIATKGTQGLHDYFTSTMRWGEIDQVLVFPEDLGELDEDEQMQRGLASRRIGDLIQYLEEDDHFFSALTLIILPRDLNRTAVEGKTGSDQQEDWDYRFDPIETPIPVKQQVGVLWLSGDVRLFPADGQHRSKSAIEAMKAEASIAKEEVPVVLIPYRDADRVRQLFSDLNLNAKPTSKTIGIDFETRNPETVAIKKAAQMVPLFTDRINRRTNSLPRTSNHVITLSTLDNGSRDIVEELAKRHYRDAGNQVSSFDKTTMAEAKRIFLSDPERAAKEIATVWTTMTELFPQRDEILNGHATPGDIRERYLFAHGLGQLGIAKATARLMAEYPDDWAVRLERAVTSFNWEREAPEWAGNAVIVGTDREGNPTYRINNTGPAVNDLAERIVKRAS